MRPATVLAISTAHFLTRPLSNPGAAVTGILGMLPPTHAESYFEWEDMATLGADVMNVEPWANWVLTRMHLRYSSDTLGDDLVFSEAAPIVEGRERCNNNEIEVGSTPSSYNNFQGRYIIRHPGPNR